MTDRRTIFLVTLFLGLVVLGGLGAVVTLVLFDKVVPELIGNVTTAALGALSALLVSTRVDPAQIPAERPSAADPPAPQFLPDPGFKPGSGSGWVERRLETDERIKPAPKRTRAKPAKLSGE
jgi:hypothetical protein